MSDALDPARFVDLIAQRVQGMKGENCAEEVLLCIALLGGLNQWIRVYYSDLGSARAAICNPLTADPGAQILYWPNRDIKRALRGLRRRGLIDLKMHVKEASVRLPWPKRGAELPGNTWLERCPDCSPRVGSTGGSEGCSRCEGTGGPLWVVSDRFTIPEPKGER